MNNVRKPNKWKTPSSSKIYRKTEQASPIIKTRRTQNIFLCPKHKRINRRCSSWCEPRGAELAQVRASAEIGPCTSNAHHIPHTTCSKLIFLKGEYLKMPEHLAEYQIQIHRCLWGKLGEGGGKILEWINFTSWPYYSIKTEAKIETLNQKLNLFLCARLWVIYQTSDKLDPLICISLKEWQSVTNISFPLKS